MERSKHLTEKTVAHTLFSAICIAASVALYLNQ